MFAAAAHGHVDVLSCLVEYGADVNTFTDDNYTPLMTACTSGCMSVVTFLIKHGANLDLHDNNGETALHHAVKHDACDVVRCLVENGADVNALDHGNCTPLMTASFHGHVNVISFLVEHGANMTVQDKNGETAIHHAVRHDSCDAVKCLVGNGADVNAHTNDDRHHTPLMIATLHGHANVMNSLVEHGANTDLQDKNGKTALHYAVQYGKSIELAHKLLTLGASQLCNNQQLTPLLYASKECMISMVEELIKHPKCTKEQRIDALEFLGASLVTRKRGRETGRAFQYIKRGMEERFQDPFHLLLKQLVDPVEAYQGRKESQTLEELAQIEGDVNAIIMESLIIGERILGADHPELLGPILDLADRYNCLGNFDISVGLYRHAMKINQPPESVIESSIGTITALCTMAERNLSPKPMVILQVLEETVLAYEKQRQTQWREKCKKQDLLYSLLRLLHLFAEVEYSEEDKSSMVAVLLQKLVSMDPRDERGNTLLHLSASEGCARFRIDHASPLKFPCPKTIKLLLNAGGNVNATNNYGETPLHKAVIFKPKNPFGHRFNPVNDKLHLLTDMLEVLLDGRAHHDFVNNDGKTAMDVAATDEARRILSERKTLELKCIAARAVKKFGLPYLGVVPKTLEKYISMH